MTDAINPTRADLLRQRRAQTSQERAPRATQRGTTPVKSQPITSRRDATPRRESTSRVYTPSQTYRTIPIAQKARTKTRRQYYYTLGATGAEVRLPAMPIIKAGPRLISGTLALLLVVLLFTFLESSTFKIEGVTVNGPQRVSAEEVATMLDMQGESIFAFDQADASARLAAAFPEFENLSIQVGLPAAITISATERAPILTWSYDEQSVWVDSQGVIFPVRGEVEGLPVIHADAQPPLAPYVAPETAGTEEVSLEALLPDESSTVLGRAIDPRTLDITLKMLPQLPADASLIYSRFSGLGWGDASGWQVFIGRSLEDIEIKMVEYQAIVSYLGTQGVTPSVISVESIHAPFYRSEP